MADIKKIYNMKIKIIPFLLLILFNCEKVNESKHSVIKNFKYENNCLCKLIGDKKDQQNFMFPIDDTLIDKGNVNLKIMGDLYLFSYDDKNVKMYSWNPSTSIFETSSIKSVSVQLDSYRKYKMEIISDEDKLLKFKVFSDEEKFSEMKSSIVLECSKNG